MTNKRGKNRRERKEGKRKGGQINEKKRECKAGKEKRTNN